MREIIFLSGGGVRLVYWIAKKGLLFYKYSKIEGRGKKRVAK